MVWFKTLKIVEPNFFRWNKAEKFLPNYNLFCVFVRQQVTHTIRITSFLSDSFSQDFCWNFLIDFDLAKLKMINESRECNFKLQISKWVFFSSIEVLKIPCFFSAHYTDSIHWWWFKIFKNKFVFVYLFQPNILLSFSWHKTNNILNFLVFSCDKDLYYDTDNRGLFWNRKHSEIYFSIYIESFEETLKLQKAWIIQQESERNVVCMLLYLMFILTSTLLFMLKRHFVPLCVEFPSIKLLKHIIIRWIFQDKLVTRRIL